MRKRSICRERVIATVVCLLDRTLIRVGNGVYARENDSFGLTTLRNRHLGVRGSELRFSFKGKSGKIWRLSIRDRRIVRIVRSIQELPGQHLFQYVGEDGGYAASNSNDVNDYLRAVTGADVTAKDFRTCSGTVLAAQALSTLGPSPVNEKQRPRCAPPCIALQRASATPSASAASATSIRPSSRAINPNAAGDSGLR